MIGRDFGIDADPNVGLADLSLLACEHVAKREQRRNDGGIESTGI
jgi:hypothetical protein